jgi:heat shock protein HslJ
VPAVMKRSLSLVSGVVAALLVTGCSGSASTPTAPSSLSGSPTSPVDQPPRSGSPAPTVDQLAGTWNLQSLQPAGGVDQTKPAGASYTLTFADGRLSTRADCNVCGGAFVLSGQTLTAGPALACTRAACPTMAFESTYTRLLSGDSTVTLSDGALVLSSARGVLHFTR